MNTVPVINVSHIDETLRTQKLSNDETTNKYQNANEFLNKHSSKQPNDLKNVKPFSTNCDKVIIKQLTVNWKSLQTCYAHFVCSLKKRLVKI